MALSRAGLPGGGFTKHYIILYDDALNGFPNGLNQALGLLAACEEDYAQMSSWFGGIDVTGGAALIVVAITSSNGGASWDNTLGIFIVNVPGLYVVKNPPPGSPAVAPHTVHGLRQLLVAEVSEMFMSAQNGDWFVHGDSLFGIIPLSGSDEGSRGEGLSRFMSVQCLIAAGFPDAVPPPRFPITWTWLNSGSRPDYITINPDDPTFSVINGCTTLFMYYLHDQLGKTINQIVAAGKTTSRPAEPHDPVPTVLGYEIPSLVGLYRNLMGREDAWASFITLVDKYYPRTKSYNLPGDNLFPVADLAEIAAPVQSLPGYSLPARINFSRQVMADVEVSISSTDHSLLSFRRSSDTLSLPEILLAATPGSSSIPIAIDVANIPVPPAPREAVISATYAGRTVTATLSIVAPKLSRLELSNDVVFAGDNVIGTVYLDYEVKSGTITVSLWASDGMASTPPTVEVGHQSASFPISTPDAPFAFEPVTLTIHAYYMGSSVSATLIVKSRIEVGILKSIEISPATLKGGTIGHGTVTLESPVSTDTAVTLTVLEVDSTSIPGTGGTSDLITIHSPVIVPAKGDRASFTFNTASLPPHTKRTAIIWASAIVSKYASVTITG
jgi:hypothetical protein